MIDYRKVTLRNGLTVVVNRDPFSKLAAVNLLYKVGSRDEEPHRTGFAHLFEHLMFRGTHQVPDYDTEVQLACGENNAFTNTDYTDFYLTLPKDNLETALWLESDRMTGLALTDDVLETEKRVVIEEFRQRYLNQPYGDQTALLRALAYRVHPYRWTTIGRTPDHIAEASAAEVEAFYRRWYRPSNAVLSVSADLDEEQMIELCDKWFGGIEDDGSFVRPALPAEPPQTEARLQTVERAVPATTLSFAFPMARRTDPDFFCGDLASDLLAGGDSARLYDRLVRERRLFSSVNAYVTGSVDAGLFVLTGQLMQGVGEEEAGEALLAEARRLCDPAAIAPRELEKVKNKFEANALFGELNVMNKAMNLGYYELLGDLGLINRETALYRSLTAEQTADFCRRTLQAERCSTLMYRALQ